jgi:hypothetical protein
MWPLLLVFAVGIGVAMMRRTNPAIHRITNLTQGRRYLLRVQDLQPGQSIGPPEVELAVQQGFSDPQGVSFVSATADPGNVSWTVIFDWTGATGEYFVWDSQYVLVDIGSTLMAQPYPPPPQRTGHTLHIDHGDLRIEHDAPDAQVTGKTYGPSLRVGQVAYQYHLREHRAPGHARPSLLRQQAAQARREGR